MSSYTESIKRSYFTWLDNTGQLLDLPRLEDESLHDYKQRLIDFVRNKSNASNKGTNNSLARSVGLNRTHVFTINVTEDAVSPYIEITSKYIRFIENGVIEIEADLYSTTFSALKILIENTSSHFIIDYYDDAFDSEYIKKLCYDNNKDTAIQYLVSSKLNILENTHIIDFILSAKDDHSRGIDDPDNIVSENEYSLNKINGFLYSGKNGVGYIAYSYYKIPYKLYYSPVVYYPMNDKDIDKIIKSSVLTDGGQENKILNSKGAEIINEITATSPLTWGE